MSDSVIRTRAYLIERERIAREIAQRSLDSSTRNMAEALADAYARLVRGEDVLRSVEIGLEQKL